MADIASLLLRITGNSQDAKRALREVRDELKTMSASEYEAQVNLNGVGQARTQLRNLEKSLDVIQARSVSAKVKVDIGDARAKLAVLRRELELAGRGGAGARPIKNILGDIGSLGGDIDRVNRRSGLLRRTLTGLGGSAATLGQQMSQTASRGLQSFIVNMVRMGFTVALVIPIIGSLLGILGALIASFSFAAAGVGLLAIAFGVALLPVIAVAAAGIISLVRAGKAMKDQQEKERVAAEAVASARDTLSGANERAEASSRSLADAQDNLKDAAVEANRAWADSIEKVKDDLLAVQYAQLGITQSNLNVKKAARDLKEALAENGASGAILSDQFKKLTDVNFKGGVSVVGDITGAGDALDIEQKRLDYKRALLDQKSAQDTLGDSKRQLNEDRAEEGRYLRDGILANKGYRDALRGVEDAQRDQVKATGAQVIAQRKLEGALAKQKKVVEEFDPATKRLADRMGKLRKIIVDTFGPLGSRVGNAALKTLEDIFDVLKDPVVKKNLDDVTDSIVGFLKDLGVSAKSDAGVSFFRRMTRAAAVLARELGRKAFGNFIRLMGRLAMATFPYLERAARRIGNAFKSWNEGAKNTGKLNGGIKTIMKSLKAWWELTKAVGRTFLAFIKDAKGEGDGLVTTLTKWFNRQAKILGEEEGRAKVIKWIKDSIQFGKEFLTVLGKLYKILKAIVDTISLAIRGYEKILGLIDTVNAKKDAGRKERSGQKTDVSILQRLIKREEAGEDAQGNKATPEEQRRTRAGIKNITRNLVDRLRQSGKSDLEIEMFLARAGIRHKGMVRRAWGGLIPGAGGFGDDTPLLAEGGEFMMRRSAVASIGLPTLEALNAGVPVGRVARSGSAGGKAGVHVEQIVLPPAPEAAIPDARWQAIQLGQELTRRAG